MNRFVVAAVVASSLLIAPPAHARSLLADTAISTPVLDMIDVVVRRREVIAIDPARSGGTRRAALHVGEKVLWSGARGRVALVGTDRRLLGITTGNRGWQELRFKVHESEPRAIAMGDRVLVVLTSLRAIGLSAVGGGFTESLIGTTESPREVVAGDNVAAVITDRRLVGLSGFFPGFAETLIGVHEDVEFASTLPNFVSIGTESRMLVFRGTTGAWSAERVSLR